MMPRVARDEIAELRALRDEYDRARDALMEGIRQHLPTESNARIARSVDWTREYIARLRKEAEQQGAPGEPESPDQDR